MITFKPPLKMKNIRYMQRKATELRDRIDSDASVCDAETAPRNLSRFCLLFNPIISLSTSCYGKQLFNLSKGLVN